MTGGPSRPRDPRIYTPATPGEPCTVELDGTRLRPAYEVEKGYSGKDYYYRQPTVQKVEGSTLGTPIDLSDLANTIELNNYPVLRNDGDHPSLVIESAHSDILEIYPDGSIYLNYVFIDPYIWTIFQIISDPNRKDPSE